MNQIYEINGLPSDFLCFFCKKLLREPLTCSECLSANFCSKCLEAAREKVTKCPQCNAVWSDGSFKANPMLKKLYEISEIKCPNKNCDWVGKFNAFFEHYDACVGKIIHCPSKNFGCLWEDDSKTLESHKKECLFIKLLPYFESMENRFMKLVQEKNQQVDYLRLEINKIDSVCGLMSKKIEENLELKKIIETQNEQIMNLKCLHEFPFSGILHHISFSYFLSKGFQIGLCEPYSYVNSYEEMMKYKSKKYVLLGGRKKFDDFLILAALGNGEIVFKETFHEKETNYHNGVYWYFFKGRSMGFSQGSNVLVQNADWVEISENKKLKTTKLSWHL